MSPDRVALYTFAGLGMGAVLLWFYAIAEKLWAISEADKQDLKAGDRAMGATLTFLFVTGIHVGLIWKFENSSLIVVGLLFATTVRFFFEPGQGKKTLRNVS